MKCSRLIVVAALLLFPTFAWADEAAPPTTPLLQAIQQAAGAVEAQVTPAPEPLPLFPEKGRDTCSVSTPCFSHCTLSCTGTTSCVGTANSVTCDNAPTEFCPPQCSWPNGCIDVCAFCECRAAGGSATQCRLTEC